MNNDRTDQIRYRQNRKEGHKTQFTTSIAERLIERPEMRSFTTDLAKVLLEEQGDRVSPRTAAMIAVDAVKDLLASGYAWAHFEIATQSGENRKFEFHNPYNISAGTLHLLVGR